MLFILLSWWMEDRMEYLVLKEYMTFHFQDLLITCLQRTSTITCKILRCTGPDESSKFRLLEAISKMRQLVTITCYSTYLDTSAFNTGLLAGFSPGWGLTPESLAFLVPHRGSRLSEDPLWLRPCTIFFAIDHISYYRDFFVHYTILLLKINQCFHELNFLFTD